MSGGTWDYEDMRLSDLADQLRSFNNHPYRDPDPEYDLPKARAGMAEILDIVGDLMHELDWHFAGDTPIEDEDAWLASANQRLGAILVFRFS